MKKTITVNADEFRQMGWDILDSDQHISEFELTICNDPENRNIMIAYVNDNNDTVSLPEYSFEYYETLQDLDDMDLLPAFLRGQGSVIYNDQKSEVSAIIQNADVHDIIGNTTWIDMMLYSSFDEINSDMDGISFSHVYESPEFEIREI